ncbi:MAG: hypothetical protein U0172_03415 [Nitrospiraceae bacterium]
MNGLLGSNWMTTAAGLVVIIFTVAQQLLAQNPIPSTKQEWAAFLGNVAVGVMGLVAKDFNKTNAPNPLPSSQPVEAKPVA